MAYSASAVPILVGEWDSPDSNPGGELYLAQQAIETYNVPNDPDLPDIAVLPLPADPHDTLAALPVFLGKFDDSDPELDDFIPNDEKILEWTAPGDYAFYYVISKYGGGGQGTLDTALHYMLAGESLVFNPGGNGPPNGLSHITIWGGNTTTVPDGGMTLLLLGAGMAALGGARRFIKS